jgi:hypothetical protein
MADISQIHGKYARTSRSQNAYDAISVGKGGEVIGKDFLLQLYLEGRVFHAQQGDAATLVDFVETAYDEDQPQFALRVPTGVTVIPISIVYTMQDQTGTDNHIVISTTTNDIGSGTSTALTISAMRTDAPRSSQCNANSLYTGNATAATGLIEVARFCDPFAAASTAPRPRYEWRAFESMVIPILVGPATLQTHVVATTDGPQGFSEVIWAELDSTDDMD